MLNKIKKSLIPMLETLGEALNCYFTLDSETASGMLPDIEIFISKIDDAVKSESESAHKMSAQLKDALKNLDPSGAERLFPLYCEAIDEIKVQYKATFFPYYDNTWDSLESVYEAFAADPQFVTELVIIPIRRNTPNGWKMVYEDYLTPRGIPNTPYQRYRIELDKPDFVFYNNPYDGVNIEQFMSHNLKPHAGCMIFIPYYLYRHRFVEKSRLTAAVQMMTELPGHDNADIFVVQGESFLKRFQSRSRNNKKMVALGNPKTDNIYKHLDDYTRYPEWEKIIKDKTVFFLNTHYKTVLNNIWKIWMPYLLSYIEAHEELALIWRPHPQSFLMRDNGESLFDRFLNTADGCGRIILDRTASAVSAMMYSNAILSQNSSIVAEAVFMDKPIFLLNKNIKEILPEERSREYDTPEYFERIKAIRRYDPRKLYLYDAVCYLGLNELVPDGENYEDYAEKYCIRDFVEDIKNGTDSKKELRKAYREQLFVNREGNCGQEILKYIKGLIQA